jgi:hypothetical protein
MAKRIEGALLNFYDLLLLAMKDGGGEKTILCKASFEPARLKHYLRLCKVLNILNIIGAKGGSVLGSSVG